jgi:hypothetical protein
MAIIIIEGSADAVRAYANTMRNAQIAQGKGALIVNAPGEDHPVRHQIEKIIAGVQLPQPAPEDLAQIPWKPQAIVLVPKSLEPALKAFEEVCPGFTKHFGPVKRARAPE